MANRDVKVRIIGKDEASKAFRNISKSMGVMKGSLNSISGMMKGAIAGALAYFSVRAIKDFAKSSIEAYGEAEGAVKSLSDALSLLGKNSDGTMADMEAFASEMQKMTKYDDEAVMGLMAMGATMGRLSGEQLKDATKAAIGLAAAYKIDVQAAMKLVAKAAMGNTTALARYGIILGDSKDKAGNFNKVLEIGMADFRLAQGEADTYTGRLAQMKNAIGDLKEEIGKALMPVVKEWMEKTKKWAEDNKKAIGEWVAKAIAYIGLAKDVFAEFINYMKSDWRGGLQYAFDSMLEIMKATFKSAVAMAIAGGKGIWAGVKYGLLGGGGGLHDKAVEEYKKQGGTFSPETDENKRVMNLMGLRPNVKMDDPEKFRKIREELSNQEMQKTINEIIKVPFAAATKNWTDAMTKISADMPAGMKPGIDAAMKKYAERLAGIETGKYGGPSALAAGEELPEQNDNSLKNLMRGRRGGLSPIISSTLNWAPGGVVDKTERNTAKMVELLKRIEKGIEQLRGKQNINNNLTNKSNLVFPTDMP